MMHFKLSSPLSAMPYGFIFILTLIFASPSFAVDTITARMLESQEYPVYPKVNYGTGSQQSLIKRGEYLVKMGDCISCHTDVKNKGAPFSGGLGLNTPFGTFYVPNITPDKDTGIGQWTDDQFVRAMREGIAPNGSNYFPAFPYPYFNRLTRDDVLAIKAYLLSVPAIKKQNIKHDVPFPFNVRFFQYGWKLLFFWPYKEEYQYNPERSTLWNRGAYLVSGLGHCGMCHSPHNLLGAEQRKYAFTGNFVNGYFAPDITSASLGGIPQESVVAVFAEGKLTHGGLVHGPMAEVNHNSLQYLTEDDLNSIALYLRSIKSEKPSATISTAAITSETGRKIYEAKCVICHTSGAAGAPKIGVPGEWTARIKQGMNVLVERAIKGIGSMPPKGTCMDCSDAEIKAAVQYIVEESKPGAKITAIVQVPEVKKLTLADGEKIYQATCSVCHAEGKLGAPKVGDKVAWFPLIDQNIDILITRAIRGYGRMPPKGTCNACSNAEIIAAVKYMVEQSKIGGDYTLW